MLELPLTAFCLNGYNEKIEIIITEIFGFPEETSFHGGYDFLGTLNICVGSYTVNCNNFYSSTGILFNLLNELSNCYKSLNGTAKYENVLENNLVFCLEMINNGKALVKGNFKEISYLPNDLTFEMQTDQTCILSAIRDLKMIASIFDSFNV